MVSRRKILGGLGFGIGIGVTSLILLEVTGDGDSDLTYGDILVQNSHPSSQVFTVTVYRKHEGTGTEKIFEEEFTLPAGDEELFEEIYSEPGEYRIESTTDSGYEDAHNDILVWRDEESGATTGHRTRIRLNSELGLNILPFSDENPPSRNNGLLCAENC